MASQYYTPKVRAAAPGSVGNKGLGSQPFNRDDIYLAFGSNAKSCPAISRPDGQQLAGTGALVFEGELLELPLWN
jgi:hypothetical protein